MVASNVPVSELLRTELIRKYNEVDSDPDNRISKRKFYTEIIKIGLERLLEMKECKENRVLSKPKVNGERVDGKYHISFDRDEIKYEVKRVKKECLFNSDTDCILASLCLGLDLEIECFD